MIQEGRVEVVDGEQLVAGPSLAGTNVACNDSGSAYQQVMSEEAGLDAVRGLYNLLLEYTYNTCTPLHSVAT